MNDLAEAMREAAEILHEIGGYSALVDDLRYGAAELEGDAERCKHGIRLPHECGECQNSVDTEAAVAWYAYESVAAILEPHMGRNGRDGILPASVTDAVQILLEHRLRHPPTERAVPEITGDTSDGYHTFNELYEFRKVYNAALFNEWAAAGKYNVHKSWRHHDGEDCFGGGWFIVVAVLPTGQISNHYAAEDWGLFNVPECERAKFEFDGHTSEDVLLRLKTLAAAPAREVGSESR